MERSYPPTEKAGGVRTGLDKGKKEEERKEQKNDERCTADDSGVAAILFPPPSQTKWSLGRFFLVCKLWFLDLVNSIDDSGASIKVCCPRKTPPPPPPPPPPPFLLLLTDQKRVDKLMETHNAARARLANLNNLWYLEVVAVHPALQSRGLGAMAMRSIVEHVGDQPIYLECTREDNVRFYERGGFRVFDRVEMDDEGSTVVCWIMLKD